MNKSDYVITNIVAFGVGSIHSIFGDGEDGEWINQYQESSAGQLAAILTLSEVLGEPGKPLPCVIQEPAYSSVEKVWLKSLGFEVVDDPDTFARVNLESLVFAVNTIMEIGWWLSRGTAPAAIISLDWCNRSCTITWPDDDSFPVRTPDSLIFSNPAPWANWLSIHFGFLVEEC
ncbi:hypothetical protein BJ875DRAFT_421741 [Amylocarpus encephaloides]|uniref:SRR1-like domain-containing protein n=1 Tax=Amylocarpus encephaloides TaxID=45428 RepID=A0A9P7YM89_9HELO|nr:hypothetical protein BJ875DRAFT_421741 [Amylocarpus encephaloides]